MRKTYKSDSLFIIQSLGNAEYQTGEQLLNRLKDSEIFNSVQFHDVVDDIDLAKVLEHIDEHTGHEWNYPIIHFECHGFDDGSGLKLRIGEVTWKNIAQYLTRIKSKSGDNLLISIGACYGLSLLSSFSMFQTSYCSAILAVDSVLSPVSLVDRFMIFYDSIFKEGSASKAVEKMNEGYSANDGIFVFYPLERLINTAIDKTLGLLNDSEKRTEWAIDLHNKIGNPSLTVEQIEDMLIAQSSLTIKRALDEFHK